MTPEELALKELSEQLDRTLKRAAVFRDGLQSPFWKELKEMFNELEQRAFRSFTDANATDTAVIIELQQVGKIGRVLEAKIMAAIEEAETLSQ